MQQGASPSLMGPPLGLFCALDEKIQSRLMSTHVEVQVDILNLERVAPSNKKMASVTKTCVPAVSLSAFLSTQSYSWSSGNCDDYHCLFIPCICLLAFSCRLLWNVHISKRSFFSLKHLNHMESKSSLSPRMEGL